jgi:hypothetical protein
MKTLISTVAVIMMFANSSFAAPSTVDTTVVKCSVTIDGSDEWIKLRINSRGKIVTWSERKLASAKPNSIFAILNESEEDSFEWVNFIVARNGFSILEAGTTADSFMVGVSRDRTKGFFRYRDLGSGNGHSSHELTCAVP